MRLKQVKFASKVLALLAACSGFVATLVAARGDIDKCVEPIKHYKELGCHPAREEGRNCPTRYLCPPIDQFDVDKCHYNETEYDSTQRLTSAKTADLCLSDCLCSEEVSPRAFRCKNVRCPHFDGKIDPTQCVGEYRFGQCCPDRYVCEEEEIDALDQCEIDGQIYLENEKFYPEKEKCHYCICKRGFDTSKIIGNKYCREINCGIEIKYFQELRDGCIPIYYENRCCPTDWRCPNPEFDKVERAGYKPGTIYCRFGDLKMKIGESLNSDDKCMRCKCAIPPLAHCVIDEECVKREEGESAKSRKR